MTPWSWAPIDTSVLVGLWSTPESAAKDVHWRCLDGSELDHKYDHQYGAKLHGQALQSLEQIGYLPAGARTTSSPAKL